MALMHCGTGWLAEFQRGVGIRTIAAGARHSKGVAHKKRDANSNKGMKDGEVFDKITLDPGQKDLWH